MLFLFLSWTILSAQNNNTTPCSARLINCSTENITGLPNQNNQFGLNGAALGICSGIYTRPTLFYKVNITSPGIFTFLIRPGTDANNNGIVDDPSEISPVDYDWAVWKNADCNNLSTTAPDRLSFAGTPPYVTGMVLQPANGNCEGPGGSGLLNGIQVNNGDQLLIAVNFYSTGSGQIPPFQLVLCGANGGGGNAQYVGIQYDLANASGIFKNEFCLGEPVILSGFGAVSSSFAVDLLPASGNTPLASKQVLSGSPNGYDITKLFVGFNFNVNTSYRIRLTVNGPCGCFTVTREFHFICCAGSTDASFTLAGGENPKLLGVSTYNGPQQWQIYGLSQYDGSILTQEVIGSSTDPVLSSDLSGPCYYVKHSITNACGTGCASQRFCKFNCNDKNCNVSKPTGLNYNQVTNNLSWSPVPGASSYIVEINVNDRGCCGPDAPYFPSTIVSNIPVTGGTSHILNFVADLGWNLQEAPCFSWRVFAVCSDGTSSAASDFICGGYGHRPVNSNLINTGAQEIASASLKLNVFPNPANGLVSILVSSPNDIDFNICVFNNTGQIVKTFENLKTHDKIQLVKWNTESLSPGVYLVKISTSKNQMITNKIIIE